MCVIGGSGSGKTKRYVKPNLMQLNANYFVTDPKGTLPEETGYLFIDNGYKLKSFNTVDFSKSQHYNPLAYVKTDAEILSFVNCFIMNTNDPTKTGGESFWDDSERLLYTALIALLRDWFPKKDYSLDGLLTLFSLAKASENDESYESPLDMLFKEIETGKAYRKNPAYYAKKRQKQQQAAKNAVLQRGVVGLQSDADIDEPEYTYQASVMKRADGVRPAECGGLSDDEDFALSNYNSFKQAAGKTLKSILISCNVRLMKIRITEVRELLKYDEMELDKLGDKDSKMVIFAVLSDTDHTFSFLHASDDVQAAESQLTDEQRQKQQNYSQDIKQFIAVLKANLWATEGKDHLVAFSDTTFSERTDQGKSSTVAYVVDAVKTDETKTDDGTEEVSTAAIEVDNETYFLTVTKDTYADGNVQYFLTGDALTQSKATYGPISASDQITVSGLNQDVLQLFGDDKGNIESAVKEYSAKYLPTYNNFVWANYATVNWKDNTVTITFTDGTNSKEILALIYDRASKSFKCNSI